MARTMTRRSILATAAPGASLALAACGVGPQPAKTAPGEVSGKVVFALVGAEQQHPPAILDGFQATHPKLTIETIRGAWNPTLEKVAEMVAAGTPPDVWYGEDGRATGWGPRGWIRDLAPYAKRDMKESDYLGFNAARDPENRLWAIPGDLQVAALFYNTAAFDEIGLKYPTDKWTLDDLTAAAQRLTDPVRKQFGFFPQPNYITTSWYLFPQLFGSGVLDGTLTKSQFTTPKVLEAMQRLMSFSERGMAPPYADQGKYPFAPAAGSEGRCAMQFHIYARLGDQPMKDLATYDVELIPAGPGPGGKRWTTVIANSWVIGKDSTMPDVSWAWIKWHSEREQQVIRAKGGSGVPMHKKAADEVMSTAPAPPKNRRAFLKSLDFAGPLGTNAVWQEWRTVAQAELLKAFNGSVPLTNALAETHRLVQVELDKFYKR
jgi:multiple sugar transport system substrate-binding protein